MGELCFFKKHRQTDSLLRQADGREFLIQVEAFLRTLQTHPQLTPYLDDALQDLAGVVEAMEQADAALSSELMALRHELVALRPDADDSDAEAPTGSGPESWTERTTYELTCAFFDECACAECPASAGWMAVCKRVSPAGIDVSGTGAG